MFNKSQLKEFVPNYPQEVPPFREPFPRIPPQEDPPLKDPIPKGPPLEDPAWNDPVDQPLKKEP